MQIGSMLDARHTVLPDDGWIQQVRAASGNDKLFLYFHRIHGTYVLCHRTSFPGEVLSCIEIYAFEQHPGVSGTMPFEVVVAMCEPQPERVIEQQIQEKAREAKEQKEADQELIDWMAKKARTRGEEGYALALETGHIPIHNEIHGDDEMERMLQDVAATASRVTRILS